METEWYILGEDLATAVNECREAMEEAEEAEEANVWRIKLAVYEAVVAHMHSIAAAGERVQRHY